MSYNVYLTSEPRISAPAYFWYTCLYHTVLYAYTLVSDTESTPAVHPLRYDLFGNVNMAGVFILKNRNLRHIFDYNFSGKKFRRKSRA